MAVDAAWPNRGKPLVKGCVSSEAQRAVVYLTTICVPADGTLLEKVKTWTAPVKIVLPAFGLVLDIMPEVEKPVFLPPET